LSGRSIGRRTVSGSGLLPSTLLRLLVVLRRLLIALLRRLLLVVLRRLLIALLRRLLSGLRGGADAPSAALTELGVGVCQLPTIRTRLCSVHVIISHLMFP